jgi:BASS family bile acid:Na+ symporter
VDLQLLIGLAINVSMFLIVFTLGLQATIADATSLFRNPGLLFRSLFAMHVVMLVAAIVIALVFNPAPVIKIALVALALSPVPPILPAKQLKSGGSVAYTDGLLTAASIASIVVVPVGLLLVSALFGLNLFMGPADIAGIVLLSIVLPLCAGILVRAFVPAFAAAIERPVTIFAWVLLIAAFLPVLVTSFPQMLTLVGNMLVLGLLAFTLAGLAVGHWLGGPDPDNRTVLALATSARHPAVAIAIAGANFPDVAQLALVVVLYHLIFGTIIAAPYVKWRTREHAAAHKGAT